MKAIALVNATERAAPSTDARPAQQSGDGAAGSAGPRAMSRVIRLCETLAAHAAGRTLSELSLALQTPKSTLLNSLRPLVQSDFLTVEGALYRLGPGAYSMAAKITASWFLPRLIAPYMRELSEATGESVGLAVPDWTTGRVVYIETVQSRRPVLYAMRAGDSAPFYASGAGRIFLAHAAPALWDQYLTGKQMKKWTSRTVTDAKVIRRELLQAREQGYWISVGQLLDDTATIAAPIFDATGNAVAAIAIGAPAERLLHNIGATRPAVVAMANRVSVAGAVDRSA